MKNKINSTKDGLNWLIVGLMSDWVMLRQLSSLNLKWGEVD